MGVGHVLSNELHVKVVKSLTKKPFYTISVEVKIAPKWPRGGKTKGKIRKKSEKARVQENDKDQIEEKLLEMLKFGIAQTKTLIIDHRSLKFDIMDVILEAGIDMDIVKHIISTGIINAKCITKEHFDKLVLLDKKGALGKHGGFSFENCATGIRFQDVLHYVEQFESFVNRRCWEFGVFMMTAAEKTQTDELANRIRQRTPVEYLVFRDRENPTINQHYLRFESQDLIKWCEKCEP